MKRLNFLLFFSLLLTASAWAHYGPRGLTAGNVSCAMVHDGFGFLGTEEGGVYVSTNNQVTAWRLRAVGLKSGRITALAHSGLHLLVGTANDGVYIFNGSAGGNDLFFNPIKTGLGDLNIQSLVAVDSNVFLAGTPNGLYRSTNRGQQWQLIAGTNNQAWISLVVANNKIFGLVQNSGVRMSDDAGASWLNFNNANTQNISGQKFLAYAAATDELVVVNSQGRFKSGTNTVDFQAFGPSSLPAGMEIRQMSYAQGFWYAATNMGVRVFDGNNFTAVNLGLSSQDVRCVVGVGTNLIAGLGEKKGVNRGEWQAASNITWSALNTGMSNVKSFDVACMGDSLIIGITEFGLMRSDNQGFNYRSINAGLGMDSTRLEGVGFLGNQLFVVTRGGVYRSMDTGNTWVNLNAGLMSQDVRKFFAGYGRAYVADAQNRLYTWANNTWTTAGQGLSSSHSITGMAFYAGRIWVSLLGGGVYVKDLDENNWSIFTSGLPTQQITAITASGDKIYVGTAGQGVFVSDWNQANWQATQPIFIAHFNDVPIDPSHIDYMTSFNGYVLATFRGGIVATGTEGQSWIRGGHQFHLPSYSRFMKLGFGTTRIWTTTEDNSIQTNSLSEFAILDTLLTLSRNAVQTPSAGGMTYHNITSNVNWTLSSNASWLSASLDSARGSRELIVSSQANTGQARTGIITLTSGTYTATLTVTQSGLSSQLALEIPELKLFPNPSRGELNIESPLTLQRINVFNSLGQLVYTRELEREQAQLNLSSLPAGLYQVRLDTELGQITRSLQLQGN